MHTFFLIYLPLHNVPQHGLIQAHRSHHRTTTALHIDLPWPPKIITNHLHAAAASKRKLHDRPSTPPNQYQQHQQNQRRRAAAARSRAQNKLPPEMCLPARTLEGERRRSFDF